MLFGGVRALAIETHLEVQGGNDEPDGPFGLLDDLDDRLGLQ